MAKTQFLTYYICLNDAAVVAANQAATWIPAVTVPGPIPTGVVNRAITPNAADTEFNAPFRGFTDPHTPGQNYIWTPWSGIGEEDGPFPLNVATFQRKTGGFWIFGGTTTRYYWMGQFVFVPPTTVSVGGVPAPPADMARVLWQDGFELPPNGDGAITGGYNNVGPGGSRHLGGLGLQVRGNTGAVMKSHSWDETGALGANPSTGWTRFYLRLRRAPDTAGYFWDCHTSGSATPAVALKFTSSRTLVMYTVQSTVLTFFTAFSRQYELDTWYRFDILLKCGLNPPNDGRFRLYVDGVLEEDIQRTNSEGLGGGGATPRLTTVRLGHGETVDGFECDFDDWSGHSMPNGTDPAFPAAGSFTGLDFNNGSRVVLIRTPAFGPGLGTWVGDARQLQTRPPGQQAGTAVTSSTSGAVLDCETDYAVAAKPLSGALGMSSLNVAAFFNRASGAVNSQIGYALDGVTYVDLAVPGATTELWQHALLSRHGVGITLPAEIAGPLRIRFIHSADAILNSVRALQATALMIGQFGPEDAPPEVELEAPVNIGIHNHPYPMSPWGQSGLPPLSPVSIIGGTYVGNSLAQDVLMVIPACFWFVRPLSGDTGGAHWFSTMLGAHTQSNQGVKAEAMIRAQMNELFDGLPGDEQQSMQAKMTPSGADVNANVTGVTFQYIAICDPGQRFSLGGAFGHGASPASADNPLVDPGFLAQLAFFMREDQSNLTTDAFMWKGPGNAATAWQVLSGAEQATAIDTFTPGVIRSLANAHSPNIPVAFMAFRDDDSTLDANGLSQRGKVVQMFSYVGDGNASRTLAFPVPVGKRPMFAVVGPTNGTVFTRDPSHTTTNSRNISGGNSTTAITGGGIDQIQIGTTLNSNAVVYNVFVVVGGTAAGNGGWGGNEILVPVEPDTAPGDQWGPEFPGEPTTPVTTGTPNPLDPGDLSTDIAADCVASSTRLCNLALNEAGITKQLVSLALDTSQEAFTARLVYKTVVDHVLRGYAWNFARTYSPLAGLTVISGTADDPVNPDWTFAYSLPSDCIRVLRVLDVAGGGRRADSDTPIAFDVIQDDTPRDLLLCNEPEEFLQEDDPVRIEYIRRVPCPGRVTDSIFRQCLIFRLGAAFAAGIAKDEKKADALLAKYKDLLPQAKVVHANEKERQRPTSSEPDWIKGR